MSLLASERPAKKGRAGTTHLGRLPAMPSQITVTSSPPEGEEDPPNCLISEEAGYGPEKGTQGLRSDQLLKIYSLRRW